MAFAARMVPRIKSCVDVATRIKSCVDVGRHARPLALRQHVKLYYLGYKDFKELQTE
jgi:hypothetical protein